MKPDTLNVLAELIGFVSAASLSWQAFRLVRHQRTVQDLRQISEQKPGSKVAELADKGADAFERTLTRWDRTDQRLVVVGLVGLASSFLLKLIGYAIS